MKRPSCACVHSDAYECGRIRDGIVREFQDDGLLGKGKHHDRWNDELCDCCCHAKDEDGFDEWDDDEVRVKGPREEEW